MRKLTVVLVTIMTVLSCSKSDVDCGCERIVYKKENNTLIEHTREDIDCSTVIDGGSQDDDKYKVITIAKKCE